MSKAFAGMIAGLALGAVFSVSALDMSVGGGGFFASDFGGGVAGFAGTNRNGDKVSATMPWLGGGIHAFFDVTYAEIALGVVFGSGTPQTNVDGNIEKSDKTTLSFTGIGLSVLGKYPITASDNIYNNDYTTFLKGGVEYSLIVSGENVSSGRKTKLDGKDGRVNSIDFSALWFKLGFGLDFNITDELFLRPDVLYGIRLGNKYEFDHLDNVDDDVDTGLAIGHGLTFKLGVGYKF